MSYLPDFNLINTDFCGSSIHIFHACIQDLHQFLVRSSCNNFVCFCIQNRWIDHTPTINFINRSFSVKSNILVHFFLWCTLHFLLFFLSIRSTPNFFLWCIIYFQLFFFPAGVYLIFFLWCIACFLLFFYPSRISLNSFRCPITYFLIFFFPSGIFLIFFRHCLLPVTFFPINSIPNFFLDALSTTCCFIFPPRESLILFYALSTSCCLFFPP